MTDPKADLAFDELCAKIAEGKATPEEVQAAFANLNEDIDAFSTNVSKQIEELKQ